MRSAKEFLTDKFSQHKIDNWVLEAMQGFAEEFSKSKLDVYISKRNAEMKECEGIIIRIGNEK